VDPDIDHLEAEPEQSALELERPGVRLSYTSSDDRLSKRLVIRTIERFTGGAEIQKIYDGLYGLPE